MKDIDFDELDRAVSSVLTNKPTNDAAPAAAVTPPEPVVPTIEPAATPEAVSTEAPIDVPAAVIDQPTTPTIQSSPAVRRGGRFMDVVHPSSDMKNAAPAAPRVPKRTLAPVSNDFVAPTPTNTPQASPNAVDFAVPAVSTPVPSVAAEAPTGAFPTLDTLSSESSPRVETASNEPEAATETHAWPDPLDLGNSEAPDTTSSPDEGNDVPAAEPAVSPEAITPSYTDPSQTPFLSDTKVNKRPLGAFTGTVDDENQQTDANAVDVPAELETDLNKIEANGAPEPETVEQPQAVSAPDQPTSIPQQYNTESKSADSDAHSVFDTSTYHQPLLPQKAHGKNHRAWIWILIIVGLLVVGAGLGALFFLAGF